MSGRTAAGLKLREKLKSRGRKILKKKREECNYNDRDEFREKAC